ASLRRKRPGNGRPVCCAPDVEHGKRTSPETRRKDCVMESRLVTRRIAAVAIAGASALVIVGGTMAPVPTAHSASHHVHSFRALSARLIFPGRASSTRLLRHRRAL